MWVSQKAARRVYWKVARMALHLALKKAVNSAEYWGPRWAAMSVHLMEQNSAGLTEQHWAAKRVFH